MAGWVVGNALMEGISWHRKQTVHVDTAAVNKGAEMGQQLMVITPLSHTSNDSR